MCGNMCLVPKSVSTACRLAQQHVPKPKTSPRRPCRNRRRSTHGPAPHAGCTKEISQCTEWLDVVMGTAELPSFEDLAGELSVSDSQWISGGVVACFRSSAYTLGRQMIGFRASVACSRIARNIQAFILMPMWRFVAKTLLHWESCSLASNDCFHWASYLSQGMSWLVCAWHGHLFTIAAFVSQISSTMLFSMLGLSLGIEVCPQYCAPLRGCAARPPSSA